MTGSLILVNNFLVSDRINHTGGCAEDSLSSSLVARFDSLDYSFDCGTQFRTQAGVMQALFN